MAPKAWEALLAESARTFDGGACSFPQATTVPIYEPPNVEYERVFFDAKCSQTSLPLQPRSAGWIIPDTNSVCKPVFVAHSLLGALWLVRETLPPNTISNDVWACLAHAANNLISPGESRPPPSAQKVLQKSQPVLWATAPKPSSSNQGEKRTSSPLESASPKRTRRAASETGEAASSVDGEADEPASIVDPAPLPKHTHHTNNTMRAEKRRREKLKARQEQKRYELGLLAPIAGDETLPKEQAAYTSITQPDEKLVAWIIKQPYVGDIDFFTGAKTPYYTACSLLEKARAMGNVSSQVHATQFLQAWRKQGALFRTESSAVIASQGSGSMHIQVHGRQCVNATESAFCSAWEKCDQSESEMASAHIKYRWVFALLGQAYNTKIEQIREKDKARVITSARGRNGKGQVRAEATDDLLALLYANPTEKDRRLLKSRVTRGMRWYKMGQALGWGSFCLVPHDVITNTWLEHTLRVPELDIWLELVRKVNPDVVKAAHILDSWLGPDGIAGGAISEKTPLGIEAEPVMTIYEIEEVQDSEDSGDDSVSVGASQFQASPKSSTRTPQLRQSTLLELFCPIT
jgi:hypothetical protein